MNKPASLICTIALLLPCLIPSSADALPKVKQIQSIKSQSPAFLNVIQSSNHRAIAVSSFKVNILKKDQDHIGIINNVDDSSNTLTETIIDTTIKWPNEVTYVPKQIFGQEGVLVANGFFNAIPFKDNSTGAVTFIDTATHSLHKLTSDKKGYYYHKAQWVDLYGNGNFGVLTARTNSTPLVHGASQLVYLTPKNNNPFMYPWNETILFNGGADTTFTLADFDQDGIQEIYAAEFFNKALTVTYNRSGKWIRRVIDNTIGPVFNIELADLAGDGKLELLATNHTRKKDLAGVFAYEVPSDISTGTFVKHTLWQDIKTVKSGFGQAAPGKASHFYLNLYRTGKPSILVDGDGAESVTILTPKSQNANDWTYDKTEIFKSGANSVIGQSAILNATPEHPTLIFTPEYRNNQVHVFEVKK